MFAATHARGAALGARRARSTGCGSTTRTACPTPAATCAGCARRSGRTAGCWWRRSSASARQLPAVVAGRRHVRLRGAARDLRACSSTRTARGCSPSSPPSTPGAEYAHAAEYAARREVADTILAAEVRRIAALVLAPAATTAVGTEPRRRVAELLCGFPVYRTYLPRGPGGARRSPCRWRARRRPDLADVLDRGSRHDARRPARRAGHPGPADLGHGDGQGRRGHRVLPAGTGSSR